MLGLVKNPGGGDLWIYNGDSKESSHFTLPDGYGHPCSIQIVRHYMIVAVEAPYVSDREYKSLILIYDIQNPDSPAEIQRITQADANCGGAGLAYHPGVKKWFILADQDTEDEADACVVVYQGESLTDWDTTPIAKYKRFGSGAGLNLFTSSDNTVWGLYYSDTDKGLPGSNSAVENAAGGAAAGAGAGALAGVWLGPLGMVGGALIGAGLSQFVNTYEMVADAVSLFKLIDENGDPVSERKVFNQITSIGSPQFNIKNPVQDVALGQLLNARPGMRFGAT